MLKHSDVAGYMMQRGFLDARSFVDGRVSVADVSRRNSNFAVVQEQGDCFLLKQGIGAQREASLAVEARTYNSLRSNRRLSGYLPRLYLYDPDAKLLIMEFFAGARNLGDYYQHDGRFPLWIGEALGEALSLLHKLGSGGMPLPGDAHSKVRAGDPFTPWVLSAHCPDLQLYSQLSNANIQLITVMQRYPEFGAVLDKLRTDWQPCVSAHNDIKLENILIHRHSTKRPNRLKLIDWEIAGLGDPCWDIGSVFGAYLGLWLSSIPIVGQDSPDRFLDLARHPLSKIQPTLRRFWEVYRRRTRLDNRQAADWLVRSAGYCGARLVQTAFEQNQSAAVLSGNTLSLMQLSYNVLARPEEAVVHLLGIPMESPNL